MTEPGIPGWFIGLFILMVIGGIVATVVRISMARSMARQAGLDPDQAAATTFLTSNGLDATYLAASLRDQSRPAPAPAPRRTAEDRLRELASLRDSGLITAEEYDERRHAVLADI